MISLPPEQRALIQKAQKTSPVDLKSLAQDLGIKIFSSQLGSNISGELKEDAPGQWIIRVNRADNFCRQRFTIAHELAHFILHHDTASRHGRVVDNVFYRSPLSNPMEREANQLAADILMPWQLIDALLNKGFTSAAALADKLQVSLTAMNIRLGIPA